VNIAKKLLFPYLLNFKIRKEEKNDLESSATNRARSTTDVEI